MQECAGSTSLDTVFPETVTTVRGRTSQPHFYFGSTPQLKRIEAAAAQIARSGAPVLVVGESGVGKETLARYLHTLSSGAAQPIIRVNCAALKPDHVRTDSAALGVFESATSSVADGSTLLLEEVGELHPALQPILLDVIKEHASFAQGGRVCARVRIIATSSASIEQAVAEGRFMGPLYYALKVVTLFLPPLRDRKPDVLPLAALLLTKHAGQFAPAIPVPLRRQMLAHSWPGNIRELENAVRMFAITSDADLVIGELTSPLTGKSACNSENSAAREPELAVGTPEAGFATLQELRRATDQAAIDTILAALDATWWNRKRAAAMLNIKYKALLYQMKKLGIDERVPQSPSATRAPSREREKGAAAGG